MAEFEVELAIWGIAASGAAEVIPQGLQSKELFSYYKM